jgi:hypothetical protein
MSKIAWLYESYRVGRLILGPCCSAHDNTVTQLLAAGILDSLTSFWRHTLPLSELLSFNFKLRLEGTYRTSRWLALRLLDASFLPPQNFQIQMLGGGSPTICVPEVS